MKYALLLNICMMPALMFSTPTEALEDTSNAHVAQVTCSEGVRAGVTSFAKTLCFASFLSWYRRGFTEGPSVRSTFVLLEFFTKVHAAWNLLMLGIGLDIPLPYWCGWGLGYAGSLGIAAYAIPAIFSEEDSFLRAMLQLQS